MSIENTIMAEMADKGLARPAGTNPEWTLLPPFAGVPNAALWPSIMAHTADGIRKGCTVAPENIQGRGAFYDLVAKVDGQAVFADLKGISRAPFYTWNSKYDLYVGREGADAFKTATEGIGQDYILVLAWAKFNDSAIRAINITKAVRMAKSTDPTSCVIWGSKRVGEYEYDRIRFCAGGQLQWQSNSARHHAAVSAHMTRLNIQSEELKFSAENVIDAITQVL